jgi:hypothetical protein
MVAVRVIGPAGDRDLLARVDSGADDTMFPHGLVGALGVTGLTAPTSPVPIIGISGAVPVQFGTVDLEIGDGQTVYRWSAYVGFYPHHMPVLGIKGFLHFFTATFSGRKRHLTLVWNGLAPPPSLPIP